MDIEKLKKEISYDPESGAFKWLSSRPGRRLGKAPGHVSKDGYITICIDRKIYAAHRLAWALHFGAPPGKEIDHIDGDRANNQIANLRLASNAENRRNLGLSKNNTSSVKGVSWFKPTRKWRAQIGVNGKDICLGYFARLDDAKDAYAKASMKYHGEFGNVATSGDARKSYADFN